MTSMSDPSGKQRRKRNQYSFPFEFIKTRIERFVVVVLCLYIRRTSFSTFYLHMSTLQPAMFYVIVLLTSASRPSVTFSLKQHHYSAVFLCCLDMVSFTAALLYGSHSYCITLVLFL